MRSQRLAQEERRAAESFRSELREEVRPCVFLFRAVRFRAFGSSGLVSSAHARTYLHTHEEGAYSRSRTWKCCTHTQHKHARKHACTRTQVASRVGVLQEEVEELRRRLGEEKDRRGRLEKQLNALLRWHDEAKCVGPERVCV